jgi:Tfp pilus assembly protein PilF
MAKIEIIQSIDSSNFEAANAEELKQQIIHHFAEKGCPPIVEIISDNSVRIVFDTDSLEKAESNFHKASALCSEGRFNAAKDLLLKAIKACPGFSEAHRLLGQVLYQQGEVDKGMDEVLEALLIDPKNMWALIMMGNILANAKNNIEGADRYYKKVLEYYPDNAIALNNVAGTLIKKKDYDNAIRYMERALILDDSYTNSYYGIALAYYQKDELDKAFDYASRGALKGASRAEDPGVRQELLKLLLTVARDLSESIDYESKVFDVAKQLESDFGITIKFEKDDEQDTLAHLEFADFHHRKEHVVKYKNDGNYCHYMLHELMHLEMMLSAQKAGKLKAIGFNQKNFDEFQQDYKRHFDDVRKKLGSVKTEELAKQLFQGMSLQVMNAPLDLFVEQRIFDKTEFRPLQLHSLFAMEMSNIEAVKQTANVAEFPQFIKDTNKLMDMLQSLMLRKLYGLDFVNYYKPSSNMLNKANEFFKMFEDSLASYGAGEEYAIFEKIATSIGLVKYFTLSGVEKSEIKTEADRQQEQFNEKHNPANANPIITMLMSSYMVGALEYFEGLLPEDIEKVAFECAMVGQNGISPAQKNGYKLNCVPGKDFGGYELLAYYYVSWAISHPEMLGKLQLPFDDAYALARKQFDAMRGR